MMSIISMPQAITNSVMSETLLAFLAGGIVDVVGTEQVTFVPFAEELLVEVTEMSILRCAQDSPNDVVKAASKSVSSIRARN